MAAETDSVWIFNGEGSAFPSGVFRTREQAEAWIAKHALTGTLSWYPVGTGAYDWMIEQGHFAPQKDHQKEPKFIGRFSCGVDHYHYEGGRNEMA